MSKNQILVSLIFSSFFCFLKFHLFLLWVLVFPLSAYTGYNLLFFFYFLKSIVRVYFHFSMFFVLLLCIVTLLVTISGAHQSFVEILITIGYLFFPHLRNSLNNFFFLNSVGSLLVNFSQLLYLKKTFISPLIWEDIFAGYRILRIVSFSQYFRDVALLSFRLHCF